MADPSKLVGLSAPWFTLQSKFANTFGCDPAVTVKDLDTSQNPNNVLPIIVDDEKKGTALRTIIRTNFPLGNVNVTTVVQNSKGKEWKAITITNAKQLQGVINTAFAGNPLFVETKAAKVPFTYVDQIGLIMTKTVVQFYNDDLSDFYKNFNGVTALVVRDLIHMSYVNDTAQILMGTQE